MRKCCLLPLKEIYYVKDSDVSLCFRTDKNGKKMFRKEEEVVGKTMIVT